MSRMHNPPHPGAVLREWLPDGMTVTDAAAALHVARAPERDSEWKRRQANSLTINPVRKWPDGELPAHPGKLGTRLFLSERTNRQR
jgi:hypothetical protein